MRACTSDSTGVRERDTVTGHTTTSEGTYACTKREGDAKKPQSLAQGFQPHTSCKATPCAPSRVPHPTGPYAARLGAGCSSQTPKQHDAVLDCTRVLLLINNLSCANLQQHTPPKQLHGENTKQWYMHCRQSKCHAQRICAHTDMSRVCARAGHTTSSAARS